MLIGFKCEKYLSVNRLLLRHQKGVKPKIFHLTHYFILHISVDNELLERAQKDLINKIIAFLLFYFSRDCQIDLSY